MGGCATSSEWLDKIGRASGVGLTQDQIVAGLKEALDKGTEHAVNTLGRENGFLENVQVRIPMPEKLRTVERTLRTLGQDRWVNEFEMTMNRAAEKAVPEAVEVLASSIRQMRLADAEAILRGADTAATDYFRRTSETNLYARFLPIVKQATAAVGVTAAYKQMMERVALGGLGEAIFGREAVDLDAYITGKALDALFLKIAEQEKLIRENPAARTTELLRKVFGAIWRGSEATSVQSQRIGCGTAVGDALQQVSAFLAAPMAPANSPSWAGMIFAAWPAGRHSITSRYFCSGRKSVSPERAMPPPMITASGSRTLIKEAIPAASAWTDFSQTAVAFVSPLRWAATRSWVVAKRPPVRS